MHKVNDSREIIGRSTVLMFVGYSNVLFPARVDTGAYRSVIHASDVHLDKNGVLHFRLFGNHPVCRRASFEMSAAEYTRVIVANSFGDCDARYEVVLRIRIGEQEYDTPFTLANRSKKDYPILLGRKALSGKYIVDVDKDGINRAKLRNSFGIDPPQDEELSRK